MILTAALVAVVVLTPIYYVAGRVVGLSKEFWDVFSCTSTVAVAIVIGYQLFFVVQFATLQRQARVISSPLDTRIPFVAGWVWVYGGFYLWAIGISPGFFEKKGGVVVFIFCGFIFVFVVFSLFFFFSNLWSPG